MEGNGDSSSKKKSVIVWSERKDLLMLKEVDADGLIQHKLKTRERGAGWLAVATRLQPSIPNVDVTARAVRDHFGTLVRKHKLQMAKEEKETGVGGEELTEKEILLEELIAICDETEKRAEDENEIKKQSVEKGKKQAVEMRKRAMERYGETKERALECQENGKQERKRRRSSDTFEWLKEKTVMEKKLREEELKEKREERESQKEERVGLLEQLHVTQAQCTAQVHHQMQQQQQQQQQQQSQQFAMLQQQMLAMMQQQQQQQTQMLANLFKNNNK